MTKEAKAPEGVSIEKPTPEPETKKVQVDIRRNFNVDPTLPQIIFPHYTNNSRTLLSCVLVRPDGGSHKEENIPADNKHPLYRDIIAQYSTWEIEQNTDRQAHVQKQGAKTREGQMKEEKNQMQRAQLWEAKQEYLKMPCMQKPEMKEFKREVRKSQTVIRAQAFAIAAILKDFDNGKEETTD